MLNRAALDQGVDSEARHSLVAPIEKDGILAAAPGNKRLERARRRGPQRTQARLVSLSEDLDRRREATSGNETDGGAGDWTEAL